MLEAFLGQCIKYLHSGISVFDLQLAAIFFLSLNCQGQDVGPTLAFLRDFGVHDWARLGAFTTWVVLNHSLSLYLLCSKTKRLMINATEVHIRV